MDFTTPRSTSVPIWGLWDHLMSAGAPWDTKMWNTWEIRGSFTPVVSLPSENVPAPPSPNWTLEVVDRMPVRQKRSTSPVRSSTSRPRSSTMGRRPARARVRAANSPAGPIPATTGGREEARPRAGRA